ncbi:hypothetical protein [Novispirillum itersonii]|uniref:hypothetical protein n=1 Tax=Novispirillum itersonii TaxID=189 RepID=UPI00037F11A5|nr:hypothetical protein [Novispirillum itersonii]
MNDTKPTLILPLKTVRNVLETGPMVCGLMILLISGPDAALVMTAGLLTVGVFSRPETTDRVTGRLLQDHQIMFVTTLIFFSALIWIPFVAGANVGMPDWLAVRKAFFFQFFGGLLSGHCIKLSDGLHSQGQLPERVDPEGNRYSEHRKADLPDPAIDVFPKEAKSHDDEGEKPKVTSQIGPSVTNFKKSRLIRVAHFPSRLLSFFKSLNRTSRLMVIGCLYTTLYTGYMYIGGLS